MIQGFPLSFTLFPLPGGLRDSGRGEGLGHGWGRAAMVRTGQRVMVANDLFQGMTSCAAWTSTTKPSPSGLKRW